MIKPCNVAKIYLRFLATCFRKEHLDIAGLLCLKSRKRPNAVELFLWAKHWSGSRNNDLLSGMQITCYYEENLRFVVITVLCNANHFVCRPLQRA